MADHPKSLVYPDKDIGDVHPDELFERLKSLANSGDPEIAHGEADDILLDLIRWNDFVGDLDYFDSGEIIDAFQAVPKWYA